MANYLIDIDGTVCEDIPNEESHRFATAAVFAGAVEWVNGLARAGHRVTFFTARTAEDREVTLDWLRRHGFEFDGLITDKPRGGPYHWVDNLPVQSHLFTGDYSAMPGGANFSLNYYL